MHCSCGPGVLDSLLPPVPWLWSGFLELFFCRIVAFTSSGRSSYTRDLAFSHRFDDLLPGSRLQHPALSRSKCFRSFGSSSVTCTAFSLKYFFNTQMCGSGCAVPCWVLHVQICSLPSSASCLTKPFIFVYFNDASFASLKVSGVSDCSSLVWQFPLSSGPRLSLYVVKPAILYFISAFRMFSWSMSTSISCIVSSVPRGFYVPPNGSDRWRYSGSQILSGQPELIHVKLHLVSAPLG